MAVEIGNEKVGIDEIGIKEKNYCSRALVRSNLCRNGHTQPCVG
jgi:hypothetical protein